MVGDDPIGDVNDLSPALKRVTVWLLVGLVVFLGVQALLSYQQRTRFEVHGAQVRIVRGPDGHYHWPGTVDGRPVEFLIDTGATRSALPMSLAQALNLPSEGTVRSSTAGGPAQGSLVRADLTLQGGLRVDGLRIVALPELAAPLLGMDVLGRLHWQQSDGVLVVDLRRGER